MSDALPAPGGTQLVLRPDVPLVLTTVRQTSVRAALTRGLAEYVQQLSFDADGGRQVRFKATIPDWAEPEKLGKFPSAAIYTSGAGEYDTSKFTPAISSKWRAPDGRFFITYAEYVQDVTMQLWTTDLEERDALSSMLEDAFNPVEWRYGFVLELPHYYNQRAVYELKDMTFEDAEDTASRRQRLARMTLGARVPLTKLVKYPVMKPQFTLEAVGDGADVVVTLTVSP